MYGTQIGVDAPIAELATVPVLTVEEDAARATALLRMIEHGVHLRGLQRCGLTLCANGANAHNAIFSRSRETFRAIALVQARVDRSWLTRLPE